MTICKFVQEAGSLNMRIVSVRGVVVLHGTDPEDASPDYMVAECGDTKKKRVTVRVKYPDNWFLDKPPKGYRLDTQSFSCASKVLMGTLKNGHVKDRYIATIRGAVNSPPPPAHPAGPPWPGARPVEGTYDAIIIISGIYNVRVPGK